MKAYPLNRVENIVSNGEIANYEQFLFLPQCFQKSSAAGRGDDLSTYASGNVYRICYKYRNNISYLIEKLNEAKVCYNNILRGQLVLCTSR